MNEQVNLLDLTLPRLTEWFAAQGEKPFRAKQVFRWIHQRGVADFDALPDRPKGPTGDLRGGPPTQPPRGGITQQDHGATARKSRRKATYITRVFTGA